MAHSYSLKDRQQSFINMIMTDTPEGFRESIYANAYRIRFEESLREDFPVAIKLDPEFPLRLETFCAQFGSQSWSMNHLAQRWMDYLQQSEQNNLPGWLQDLYQLENLQFQSYFLNSDSARDIGKIDLGEGIFITQSRPFLMMTSEWDVESIWQNETPPHSRQKSMLLFYKTESENTFVTVDSVSSEILTHLFQEKSLENLPLHLQNSEILSTAFTFLSPLFSK